MYDTYYIAHGAFFSRKITFMSFTDYLRDTRGELKHVSWPTRKQAIVYTILTIVISVALSFYLGFFDFIFSLGLEKIVTH